MKLLVNFLLFFLIIISINQNVFAQNNSYKYGNVIYQLPSGYRQDVVNSSLMLVPQGQSPDNAELAFVIAPGINNAPRDLSGSLHSLVSELEAGREVIKRQTSTDSANGIKIVSEVSVTRINNEVYISMYILTNPGGRGELLALITTNPNSIEKYQRQIGEFFGGISFANLNETTVAQNSGNSRSYNNTRQRNYSNNSNSSRNQQLQRNRTYANQIFLNSITNNYNSLSGGFR